jgi:hypothetical protein
VYANIYHHQFYLHSLHAHTVHFISDTEGHYLPTHSINQLINSYTPNQTTQEDTLSPDFTGLCTQHKGTFSLSKLIMSLLIALCWLFHHVKNVVAEIACCLKYNSFCSLDDKIYRRETCTKRFCTFTRNLTRRKRLIQLVNIEQQNNPDYQQIQY